MDTLMLLQPGAELGVSDWLEITQRRIDCFAEATDDRQFIHVDPARAAATPFGGPIAHGFLILSLLPLFGAQALRLPDNAFAMNYGLDRLRFVTPVRAGRRVRGRFALIGRTAFSPARLALKLKVAVEIEGESKPALTIAPMILLVESLAPQDRQAQDRQPQDSRPQDSRPEDLLPEDLRRTG